MSIEKQSAGASPEELEKAWARLEESETLRTDQYAQQVLEKGGISDRGDVIDVNVFLDGREAYLEDNKEKMAAFREKNPGDLEKAMVVHSVKPEFEKK